MRRGPVPGTLLSAVIAVVAIGGSVGAHQPAQGEDLCLARSPETLGASPSPALIVDQATLTAQELPACPDDLVVGTADELLTLLETQPEVTDGYDRDLFPHWRQTNGCKARRWVLIEESLTPVSDEPRCSVEDGTWHSAYDDITVEFVSNDQVSDEIEIDHMIPLAEAWRSGAHDWSREHRREFANDLGDHRSLRAVTAASNGDKSDDDPSVWLPIEAFRCDYVGDWVIVKVRWQLAVDGAERATISGILDGCPAGTSAVRIWSPE